MLAIMPLPVLRICKQGGKERIEGKTVFAGDEERRTGPGKALVSMRYTQERS